MGKLRSIIKLKLSLSEPHMLVYYYLKSMGLAPFTLKNGKFDPPTLLGTLYTICIFAIHLSIISIEIDTILGSEPYYGIPIIARIASTLDHGSSIASTIITPIVFLVMYKRALEILDKLRIMSSELESLGIVEDLTKIFKNHLVTSTIANAVIIPTYAMTIYLEHAWSISSLIRYYFEMYLKFTLILMFNQTLLFIANHFRLLNKYLYDAFEPAFKFRSLNRLRMFAVLVNPQGGIKQMTDLQRIRKIELLHLNLTELTQQTTGLFAIPILLECFQSAIQLMASFFWTYFVVQNSYNISDSKRQFQVVKTIAFHLLKSIIVIVQLFAIAYASEKTCEQGNAAKAVLYKIWYKFQPKALAYEFHMFALQMLHKPVAVCAFGFFDLGYPILATVFSTVVAYVIILIQFNESNTNA